MRKKILAIFWIGVIVAIISFATNYLQNYPIPFFQTAGPIAEQQRNLFLITVGLMLIVVIPVFVMAIMFSLRYREKNTAARYDPQWDSQPTAEVIWWGVPIAIIAILAIITWFSSHSLDPFKPLDSNKKPLTIQVVALQWRWLFLYPKENIATVNYVALPEKQPIEFVITSDAPMNSFWIPRLGGQIYAMSGMSTKLHLMADNPGIYDGSSANISGEGFAGMQFKAHSMTKSNYENWVKKVKSSPNRLSYDSYIALSQPSKDTSVLLYGSQQPDLYDTIIAKYMGNTHQSKSDSTHHTMENM